MTPAMQQLLTDLLSIIAAMPSAQQDAMAAAIGDIVIGIALLQTTVAPAPAAVKKP